MRPPRVEPQYRLTHRSLTEGNGGPSRGHPSQVFTVLVAQFSGSRSQGNAVQFPDSHSIPTSIPSEFPRIDVSGRVLGKDEMDSAIQTASTSKVRRVEIAPLSGSACSIEASGPVTFSQPDFATARCV